MAKFDSPAWILKFSMIARPCLFVKNYRLKVELWYLTGGSLLQFPSCPWTIKSLFDISGSTIVVRASAEVLGF